jgi:hypothetical protein
LAKFSDGKSPVFPHVSMDGHHCGSKRKFLKKTLVSGGSAEAKEASNQTKGGKKNKKHSYIRVTSELPSLHIFFINKQL